MVFSSMIFLCVFLPIVLIVYFVLPKQSRNLWLLLASLFFYAWGEPRYILIMLFSTVFDYCNGRAIEYATAKGKHDTLGRAVLVLPVQVSPDFLKKIFSAISADPAVRLRIDLPSQEVTLLSDGSSERFEISAYKKYCFENALDDIDYLLEHKDKIEEYETEHSKIAR